MGKVIFELSMSLDGFVRATGNTPEEPLGKGGERLHDWAMADETGAGHTPDVGAYLCGRGNYADSLPFWKADGPTGAARVPVFVVTHHAPADVPDGGVYTFVTDGIDSALRQARAAAGGKNILVQAPDVGSQFIRAGLVDELCIHLVPVLFGGGLRLFDHIGDGHIQLDVVSMVDTPLATHLRYRIVR